MDELSEMLMKRMKMERRIVSIHRERQLSLDYPITRISAICGDVMKGESMGPQGC